MFCFYFQRFPPVVHRFWDPPPVCQLPVFVHFPVNQEVFVFKRYSGTFGLHILVFARLVVFVAVWPTVGLDPPVGVGALGPHGMYQRVHYFCFTREYFSDKVLSGLLKNKFSFDHFCPISRIFG